MKRIAIVLAVGLALLIGIGVLASTLLSLELELPTFSQGIAIIPIKGEISAEKTPFSVEMSAFEIVDSIAKAEADPAVGAILLEINSPGGSTVATRQIVEKVREARESKPIVSWISEAGTSGAYYVAAASDYIVADPDSITGSIGVISVLPNVGGLLEKLGVKVRVLKEGRHKDIGSVFSDLNKEEEMIIQKILHGAFARFKGDILLFRGEKIDKSQFEEIADGRILSGEQAFSIGLVDKLGSRAQAVSAAASIAGISEPKTMNFGKAEPTILDLFSSAGYSFAQGFKLGLLRAQSNYSVRS
jgi:protease-4